MTHPGRCWPGVVVYKGRTPSWLNTEGDLGACIHRFSGQSVSFYRVLHGVPGAGGEVNLGPALLELPCELTVLEWKNPDTPGRGFEWQQVTSKCELLVHTKSPEQVVS